MLRNKDVNNNLKLLNLLMVLEFSCKYMIESWLWIS